MSPRRYLALSLVLSLTACSDDTVGIDGGLPLDAATGFDAGQGSDGGLRDDTGIGDTGVGTDTGTADTGTPNAGDCLGTQDQAVFADPNLDVGREVTDCAASCSLNPDRLQCVQTCFSNATGLSQECSFCFAERIECAFTNCPECVTALPAGSPACTQCQMDNNCISRFETCSGLR